MFTCAEVYVHTQAHKLPEVAEQITLIVSILNAQEIQNCE